MDALPGGSNNEEICINRITLVSYYRECQSKRDVDRMHYLCNKVANALRVPELSSDIKSVLSKLVYTYKKKLETSHKNFERCKNSNKNWFETYVTFPVPSREQKRSSGSGGRPVKDFEDCSERTKRKKTEDVRKNLTPAELAFAAQMEYRAAGEVNKSKLIKDISAGTTLKSVNEPHARYTPDKALSLVIESHLTKHQYNLLRKSALELNCNLYPNYESVTEAKKKCYPEGIMCTEIKAEVSLQNLLNHTAERLLLSLKEVILHLHPNQRQDLCLISKWGCDGSGSHSQYKQKFQDQESSDEHMMVTTIVPIRVITTNNVLVWQNPRPSSPRYCRPLRLQMAPETSELSRQEAANLQIERADLLPTKNEEWCIKHDLKLTMVDGKMINALTDTSSAMRCYLCGATSKDFNKINVCLKNGFFKQTFKKTIHHDTPFTMYKTVPIPMIKHNKHSLTMKTNSEYIAVNIRKETYMQLTDSDLEHCIKMEPSTFVCSLNKPTRNMRNHQIPCEIGAITNITLSKCIYTSESCNNKWTPLQKPNTWIYVCCTDCQLQIICEGRMTTKAIHSTGILEAKEGCIIRNIEETYYTQVYYTNNIYVSPEIPLIDLDDINNLTSVQPLDLSTGQQNTQFVRNDYEKLHNSLKELEDQAKQAEMSQHDVHQYIVSYSTMGLLILSIVVAGGTYVYCKRSGKVTVSDAGVSTRLPPRKPPRAAVSTENIELTYATPHSFNI